MLVYLKNQVMVCIYVLLTKIPQTHAYLICQIPECEFDARTNYDTFYNNGPSLDTLREKVRASFKP